jgi:hypothetical protein
MIKGAIDSLKRIDTADAPDIASLDRSPIG